MSLLKLLKDFRLACTLWCLLPNLTAFAADYPLDIECQQIHTARSESPFPVRSKFIPDRPGVLQGKLPFRAMSGNDVLFQVVTEDIAISPNGQTMRWLLPPPSQASHIAGADLVIDFIAKDGKATYGPFPLRLPVSMQRTIVIGSVTTETARTPGDLTALFDSLNFDGFNPLAENKSTTTAPSQLYATDIPGDALSFCAYDLMVAAEAGFAALKPSQLAPLLEWVEGGGSLCLMPRGAISNELVDWLNQLLKNSGQSRPLFLDTRGHLTWGEGDQKPEIKILQRGLGRIVLVLSTEKEPIDPNSTTWRRAVAALWRLRADQARALESTGKWSPHVLHKTQQDISTNNPNLYGQYQYTGLRGNQLALIYNPISSGDHLVDEILPSNLKTIPLSLIMLFLVFYIVMIGPVDYLVLKHYKILKWTWVTFPVFTLVFSGLSFVLLDWYMNIGDSRRTLSIVDYGQEGHANRVNQLEMHFNSRRKVVQTELRKSLFTPINHQLIGTGSWMNFQNGYASSGVGFVSEPIYQGRVPSQFAAHQSLQQRRPQLNRILSFQTPSDLPEIDWKKFALPTTVSWQNFNNAKEIHGTVVKELKKALGESVTAGYYNRYQYHHLCGENRLFHRWQADSLRPYQPVTPQEMELNRTKPGSRFLQDICVVMDAGLFSVRYRTSPHGGRQFEDLTLLDPSDDKQYMLVIGLRRGQDVYLLRKVYNESP